MTCLRPCVCMFLCLLAGAIALHQQSLTAARSPRRCRCSSATRSLCLWDVSRDCSGVQVTSESPTTTTTTTTSPVLHHHHHHRDNTDALNDAIRDMCRNGKVDTAIHMIREVEESMSESSLKPNQSTYVAVINSLGRSQHDGDAAERAEELLHHMTTVSKVHGCCAPKGQAYSAVISAWANSKQRADAAQRADLLLGNLWSLFNSTQDKAYLPTRATYASTMTAWARCAQSKQAAERAEELLEEMEAFADQYPMLRPTTACVNAVLNAWSKSNDRGAAQRSEVILKRMEGLALGGRRELQPDTVSFNTVLDTLARSGQRDAQRRAEILLGRMDDLSKGVENVSFPCEPDTLSFNIVINSWTKSREQAAARRAESILRHMEKRYETKSSNVVPDSSTYNSVIHAWSRSREAEAPLRADAVLRRMESAYENGNSKARPDSTSFNSLINVWAKSKHPRAGERALEILALMKKLSEEKGKSDCRPDVWTYTSVIDAVAKQSSPKAADRAVLLLTEVEEEYKRTRDECIKPNIRTYTSAINAIARSRWRPERAEAILDRLETLYESGELDVRADSVCYNAVINAWGWSNEKGKSGKAHNLYQRMMDALESGKNPDLKPDITTCNSLLNACAFEKSDSEADRAAVMEIAIQSLEAFQAVAPKYGWPNHITFSNMLLAIGRQMPMSERRLDLAEATFWQCCKAGHVSALVISHLRNALDEKRLKSVMGPALFVNQLDSFSYDMQRLPREWRRCAPQPRGKSGQGQKSLRRTFNKKSSDAAP